MSLENQEVDVWSIGVILYQLLSGFRHPFYHKNDTMEGFSARVINEKIDWENITNNHTWGDDDDQPSGDKEERAM